MDFTHSESQRDAAGLAKMVLADACTPERLRLVDSRPDRFDPDLMLALAETGLLGLCLPEEYAGSGMGLLELCSVLVEAGRMLAPVPLGCHIVTALALAEFGSGTQRSEWLPGTISGDVVLTSAIGEPRNQAPHPTATHADHDGTSWSVTGVKSVVPAGTIASLFVVPAATTQGVTCFLVRPDDVGVRVEEQLLSDGDRAARLVMEHAVIPADRVLGGIGHGEEVADWLAQRLLLAVCAQQVGTLQGALELTSTYAKNRQQFGRPIGTFQAVGQRLADAYIDALGAELTLWEAAWRLAEGLPAEVELATAKLWAADAGHRLAHTTVHIHGGVGIDLDGEAHRYFTAAKRNEFTLGGASVHALAIGRALAKPRV